MIDYRELLKKYMAFMFDFDGMDWPSQIENEERFEPSGFTADERKELKAIFAEGIK